MHIFGAISVGRLWERRTIFFLFPVHICGTLPPLQYEAAVARQSRRRCSPCCRSDEKSGGGPCPQERCLAGAYFGWACPNKHSETLQPQLRAFPWLTSPVLWLLHSQSKSEKTSQWEREGERDSESEPKPAEVRRAKRCLLSEPGLSHACRTPRVQPAACLACQKALS